MATLLLAPPAPTVTTATPTGTAELVILLSPIRGADGQLRVTRSPIPAGQTVAAVLPPRQEWHKVIVNGRVLTPSEHDGSVLQPGDEVLAMPSWGLDPVTAGLLITFAVGIAVSLATTGLTYLLFPPAKPAMQAPVEDPTFSFDGIRTTIGPGSVVPVVYGHQRIGGQLLSYAVDEVLTVLDNGAQERRVTAIAGSSTMTLLLALCEGPIDTIQTDTIELNGQPIQNFPQAQVLWRIGTPDQTALAEFLETRNTFAVNALLSNTSVIYTTTAPVNAFTLNLAFLEGLFFMSRHGEKETNSSFLEYRFRLSDVGAGAGVWSPYFAYRVDADRTAPVRFGIRREGLFFGIWDIEVFWASAWNTDETRSKWLPTLVGVTEIQSNTNAYPNTALLGIRSVATDQLQGGLPNVTVEVHGRMVRVNTFATTETYSDNPAWCIMDAMTNARYGLGGTGSSPGTRGISDGDIDLGAFATWATYCDQDMGGEKRHTFNYVLDREVRAQPFLLETMGGSRTIMVKSGGLWQPRPTRNDPPTQLLSWTNVTNLTLTYLRDAERINVMEARFDNEDNNFQTDVLTWPTVANWPANVRKASVDIRGVTKPSRIIRALQFELNRRRFENLTMSCDASLEAITFSVHDLFRFAHPLPGWSLSGRIQAGSTGTVLYLDEDVSYDGVSLYHVHVRHADDTTEVQNVASIGTRRLTLAASLSQTPVPRQSTWMLGTYTATAIDLTGRVFRVTKAQRKSDTTVHLEAVIHNPSIYDEADAVALPVITGLFNPLGPPPPLTHLVATEVTRMQASGASLRVVNLSWDVAGLATGYAPYGGAQILRRAVAESSLGGSAIAGTTELGAIQNTNDPNFSFVPLTRVMGYTLDYDDYSVITGGTYVYRVVPVSQRGVPNNNGSLDAIIHVSGPTSPDYFPGTVQNLRLWGQAVGVTQFEGRDIHIAWEPIADNSLFTSTFYVYDYLIEIWAPGQEFLLRRLNVPAQAAGQTLTYSYTLDMNTEDNIRTGKIAAARTLSFYVWARTNTNRFSLDPAAITVSNPPPDMGDMLPAATGLFQAAIVDWTQFARPRDFHHFEVYLDLGNPPTTIYQDVGINFQKLLIADLLPDVPYYVYILPYDTFGPGIPSQIATFTAVNLTADALDTVPPGVPTGLALTTGTTRSDDGTIMPWVQASWNANPESDVAGYELRLRIDASADNPFPVDSSFSVGLVTSHRVENIPGNLAVHARLATLDRTRNISAFTAEVSITTARDTVAPAAPTDLVAIGSIRSIALLWTPPADRDYAYSEVAASMTNNRATSQVKGQGLHNFVHEGLGPTDTWYYWLRSFDTSGNSSAAYYPSSATGGIPGTSGQLDTTYISSLAANKIIAGTIEVLVRLGVANSIELDGVQQVITVRQGTTVGASRVQMGKLGALATDWGIRVFDENGQTMFDATQGGVTAFGIKAGTINSSHLRTDTLVVTLAAQIANAIIGDAHITNLAANKIDAGTITVQLRLGVGNIILDGGTDLIEIYDDQPLVRVQMGRLGGGANDWGLRLWNAAGGLMWDFTTGAQTLGLADLAVTTAKIGNAQITSAKIGAAQITNAHIGDAQITRAKIGNLEVDSAKIENLTVGTGKITQNAVTFTLTYTDLVGSSAASTETEIGSVTFDVNADDQVWIVVTGLMFTSSLNGATLRIREDSVSGTGMYDVDVSANLTIPCPAQALYTADALHFNKKLVLTLRSSGSDSVYYTKIKIVALRRQK